MQRLRARIAGELRSTFASEYSGQVLVRRALEPDVIAAHGKRATDENDSIAPRVASLSGSG